MGPPGMKAQDFYKLERSVQERLIGCMNGTGLPAPTLSAQVPPLEPLLWLLASGGLLVLTAVLSRIGLGSLESPMAIHGVTALLGYVALFGGSAFALVRAAAVHVEFRALPFKPGVYLFPIGVIDARKHVLHIFPIDDLTDVVGPTASNSFTLSFKGGSFEFRARNAQLAAQAAEAIAASRGPQDRDSMVSATGSFRPPALDPLEGFVNPLTPSTSLARHIPVWGRFAWAVAIGVGLLLGVCTWLVRNVLSDDRMFALATEQGDATSLRAYLARGTRHRAEIEVVLLPRAELIEAKQKGTVDAIEKFIADHPATGIAGEIDAALKAAMLAELEVAKKAGTVTALKEFATRHPTHQLGPELKAATHAVYVAALERWKTNDAPKDPAVTVFVERLFAWVEKRGPKVELRFRRRGAKSLTGADLPLGKSRYFMGGISFPSPYNDVKHMASREDALAKAVVARFAEAFPADVLALEVGPPVDDADAPLPAVKTPTWFIDYMLEWDGGLHTSDRPRGVFIGVGYSFDATFRVPDDTKPLRFKLPTLWRAPQFDGLPADEHPAEKVYGAMADSAFDYYGKKLLGSVFATKAPQN